MKKLFSLTFFSFLLGTLLVHAETYFNINGLSYTITNENNATVSVGGDNVTGDIIIPDKVEYLGKQYTVSSIRYYGFGGSSHLKSMSIPETVTSIGGEAFTGCVSLESISLPKKLSTLPYKIFLGCTALKSINLPQELMEIGSSAFWGCSLLEKIHIPESVTSIGFSAFTDCTGITEVYLPASLIKIGHSAFSNCSSIKTLNLPNNITTIENDTFSGCSSLAKINLPENLTTLGNSAFQNCSSLTALTLPQQLVYIGNQAFNGCVSLEELVFENGISPISLGTHTFGENNIKEGKGLFFDCPIKNIYLGRDIEYFDNSTYSSYIDYPKRYGYSAFNNITSIENITIGKGVSEIKNYTFETCKDLRYLTIEASENALYIGVMKNGNSIFSDSGLNSIQLGRNISFKKMTLPYYGPFENLTNLETVFLSDCVTAINDYLFRNCPKLTTVAGMNLINKLGIASFDGCKSLSSVKLSSNLNDIPNSCFRNCTSLQSIVFPATLNTIGSNAFENCSNLKSVRLPENITVLQRMSFSGCSKMTSFDLSSNLTEISEYALSGCVSLGDLCIPKSVTTIGTRAFSDCLCNIFILGNPKMGSSNSDALYGFKGKVYLVNHLGSAYCDTEKLSETQLPFFRIDNIIKTIKGCSFSVMPTHPDITIESVSLNGNILTEENGNFTIDNLPINSFPEITISGKYRDEAVSHTHQLSTKHVWVELDKIKTTQTTISFFVWAYPDETITITKGIENMPNLDCSKRVTLTGLIPNTAYELQPYALYGNEKVSGSKVCIKTNGTSPSIIIDNVSPTTAVIKAEYNLCDANLRKTEFLGYENTGDQLSITGLEPNTNISIDFIIETVEGSIEKATTSFTTPNLEFQDITALGVAEGISLLSCISNLNDNETACGFEWRKIDAPDIIESKIGFGRAYNGLLQARLNNLDISSYYKARAIYTSDSGKRFASDWIGIDPVDFSYIEPIVHTYDCINTTERTAFLRGYVLAGSDNIIAQGIEYWFSDNDENLKLNAESSKIENVESVFSTGQIFDIELTELYPGTEYLFRTFVKTNKGTFYGDTHSFFTTGNAENLPVCPDNINATHVIGYFDYSGVMHKTQPTTPGIYIIKYSDGTTQKVHISR